MNVQVIYGDLILSRRLVLLRDRNQTNQFDGYRCSEKCLSVNNAKREEVCLLVFPYWLSILDRTRPEFAFMLL
jgi:hypothetical protein